MLDKKKMLDPAAYLATLSQVGGGGDTLLYSNLKVIAVPVLATILHKAHLKYFSQSYFNFKARFAFESQK